ncbi:MAG: LacI family DNA-binding transcriptional regulator [Spirochaetia bacterium]|nr:LacI family DNA-binding transcriptional regulator [Spirochaetia bacterium]
MQNTQNRITIKDIAKRANVSPRSVSLALNNEGRLSSATRENILKIAKEMDYQPNILARGLVNQKTYMIGVVLPYLTNSFFTNIISDIEERCLADGYDILLGNSSSTIKSEKGSIERMVNRRVDGIICCPDPRYFEFYNKLLGTGIPLIQIMTHIKGIDAKSLLVDDEEGGFLATNHLLELGHEKIGFVSFHEDYYEEIQLRGQGFRRALVKNGISLDLERFEMPSDLTIKGGYDAAVKLLQKNPDITAIFSSTDLAALGVIEACLDVGKRVPEDISVVGYDDIDFASLQIRYPLTTIAQPKDQIGALAFEMLKSLIAGNQPESILLKPELVVRKTTGQK